MTQQCFEIESLNHHGQMIRGTTYLPQMAGRCPTVLLLHGFTGQRAESGFLFVQLARKLNTAGVACVTFDFRHSGESDGIFEQMLVTGEVDDALRVTQWLAGQPFVNRSRMGLLGFSLGGLVAACVTARTMAYKALMLLAPTTERNLARIAETRTDEHGRLLVGAYQLHENFIADLLTLDSVADITRNPRPTLLIQGDKDTAVPPPVSDQYVQAMRRAGVPVEHVMIPQAEHTFATPACRGQLLDTIGGFVTHHLG